MTEALDLVVVLGVRARETKEAPAPFQGRGVD